eukprot:jgi/Picsp_1/1/NSC_00001-R1
MIPQSKGNSDSNVAVIIALSFWDYSIESEAFFPLSGESYKVTGRNFSVAAGRISFSMGYSGPSIAVDTACSSSLVALSIGASVRSEYTCTSLTFGSSLLCLSVGVMRPLLSASMLSFDGRCKTLDVHADGYGRGEASICMRLSDSGPSLAIIRSICVNQDGKSASLTAPHGPSQSKVILGALRMANLRPIDVHAQEIHGTGTPLGDPIEINSITKIHSVAFGVSNPETSRKLALTAWKTWFGHSEPASGAVGILHGAFKTRQSLCGSLMHLSSPSKYVTDSLRFKHLQLLLSRQDAPLPHLPASALVGISSFAFQGTNSHAAVEYKCSGDGNCTKEKHVVPESRKFWGLLENNRFWYAPAVRPGIRFLQASAKNSAWTVELSHPLTDYLRDHKVKGRIIVPGMFFLESIMSALKGSFHYLSNSLGIRNYVLERPLFLNSKASRSIHIYVNFFGSINVLGDSPFGYKPHVTGMLGTCTSCRRKKLDESCEPPKAYPLQLERQTAYNPVYCIVWRNMSDGERPNCVPTEILDAATHLGAILAQGSRRLAFLPVSLEILIGSQFSPKHNPSHPWCSLVDRRDTAENSHSSYFLQSQGQQAKLLELASKGITASLEQHSSAVHQLLNYDRSFLLDEIVDKHRVLGEGQLHFRLTKPRFMNNLSWYDSLYPPDCEPERLLVFLSCLQLPVRISNMILPAKRIPYGVSSCLHCSEMMKAVLKVASNESISVFDETTYCDANSSKLRIFWKVSERILAHSFDGKSIFKTIVSTANSWIVSGGTSGIGLLFGIWNSFQSSHKPPIPSEMALVSRSGLIGSHMAKGLISNKNTLRINVIRCDVSYREDARIFQCLKFPTSITCIFHSAGVIRDALIPKVKAREAFYVYAPKVAGTKNASLGLSQSPVADIIMASTISYLIGNRGQTTYAAANAEMDGIALGMLEKGMLARSILFGPWADIGMLSSSPNVLCTLSRIGIHSIGSQEGLSMLNSFLYSRSTFRIVASMSGHFLVDITMRTNSHVSRLLKTTKCQENQAVTKPARHGYQQRNHLLKTIKSVIESVLGRSISDTSPFLEAGIDSLGAVEIRNELSDIFQHDLPATVLFDYPNLEKLLDRLQSLKHGSSAEVDVVNSPIHTLQVASKGDSMQIDILVTGIGQRLPCCPYDSYSRFFHAVHELRNVQNSVPSDRWDADLFFPVKLDSLSMNTKFGAFADDIWSFDAPLFSLATGEAMSLDPQARQLLQTAVSSLWDSGLSSVSIGSPSTCGAYVGCMFYDYQRIQEYLNAMTAAFVLGNGSPYLCGRLSYTFGLQGPCVGIDTACSSSLVATNHAECHLKSFVCDSSIVSGVNAIISPRTTSMICQLNALSDSGRCLSLDAAADGYGRGEAFVTFALQTKQGYISPVAVLKGSSVNQDGRSSSLTSPNGPAQEVVMKQTLQRNGIFAHDLGSLSMHGTGTSLGDPIEIQAITKVHEARGTPIALSAIKSLHGHSEGAAGCAGLLSSVTVSAMRANIPNNVLRNINTHISHFLRKYKRSLLHISRQYTPLIARDSQDAGLAGTSSYGMSGTNAHAIVVSMQNPILSLSAPFLFILKPFWPTFSLSLVATEIAVHEISFKVNTSTFSSHRLDQHSILGERIIPGAAYLMLFVNAASVMQSNLKITNYDLQKIIYHHPCRISALQSKKDILIVELDLSSGIASITTTSRDSSHKQMHCRSMIVRPNLLTSCHDLSRTGLNIRTKCFTQPDSWISSYTSADYCLANISMMKEALVDFSAIPIVDSSLHIAAINKKRYCYVPSSMEYFESTAVSERCISSAFAHGDWRKKENGSLANTTLKADDMTFASLNTLSKIYRNRYLQVRAHTDPGIEPTYFEEQFVISHNHNREKIVGHRFSSSGKSNSHSHTLLSCIDLILGNRNAMAISTAKNIFTNLEKPVQSKRLGVFQLESIFMTTLVKIGQAEAILSKDMSFCCDSSLREVRVSDHRTSGQSFNYTVLSEGLETMSGATTHDVARTFNRNETIWSCLNHAFLTSRGALAELFAAYLVNCGCPKITSSFRSHRSPLFINPNIAFSEMVDVKADLSSREDKRAFCISSGHGLILHTAASLWDATIPNIKPAGIRATFASKINVSDTLLEFTNQQPFEIVAYFSSIAGIFGSPGQASYANANRYLDAQACQQRIHGCNYICIQWGLWSLIGLAADSRATKRAAAIGLKSFSPAKGLEAFRASVASLTALKGSLSLIFDFHPNFHTLYVIHIPFLCSFFSGTLLQKAQHFQARKTLEATRSLAELKKIVTETVIAQLPEEEEMELERPLSEIGLDSLSAVEFSRALTHALKMEMPTTLIYDYPTVKDIAEYVVSIEHKEKSFKEIEDPVIFFEQNGQNGIIIISDTAARYPSNIGNKIMRAPMFTIFGENDIAKNLPNDRVGKQGSFDDGIVKFSVRFSAPQLLSFDNEFFKLPLISAIHLDPNARWMLSLAVELRQNTQQDKNCGFFLGCMWAHEYFDNLKQEKSHASMPHSAITGNSLPFLAGQISYTFRLTGPCLPIDTACSSSLVGLHYARKSLLSGEISSSLVAGSNCFLSYSTWRKIDALGALSRDGRCKSFDASADGYGRGEGFAMVSLKFTSGSFRELNFESLEKPVLLSSSINNAGRRSSLTAPNGPSQKDVTIEAIGAAKSQGFEVNAVVGHATGTSLGDPIEIQGLFEGITEHFCDFKGPIMSIKSILGHGEGCAGVSNILGSLESISRQVTLPIPQLRSLNSFILQGRIFGFPREISCLPTANGFAAGSSSFGMTGVNAYSVSGLQRIVAEHTHETLHLRSSHLKQKTLEVNLPHNLQIKISMHERIEKMEFSLRLSSADARLRDHVIEGKRIVPGSAFLLAASMMNLKLSDTRMSHLGFVNWIKPIKFDSEILNITIQIDMAYNLILRNDTTTACSLQLCRSCLQQGKQIETCNYSSDYKSRRCALFLKDWRYRSLKQTKNLANIDNRVKEEEPFSVNSIAIIDGSLHLSAASKETQSLLLPQSINLFVYMYSSRLQREHLAASSAGKADENTSLSSSNAVLCGQERSSIALCCIFKHPQKKTICFDANNDTNLVYEIQYEAMDPTISPNMTMGALLAAAGSSSLPEINHNIFLSGNLLDYYSCFMQYIAIFREVRNKETQLPVNTQSDHCIGLSAPHRRRTYHDKIVSIIITVLKNEDPRNKLQLNHNSFFWNDLGARNRFTREPIGKTVAQANVNYSTTYRSISSEKNLGRYILNTVYHKNGFEFQKENLKALHLEKDEVEVEVLAIGLNFRDILNVLGMYPGDAGEAGSDFAGKIVNAGESTLSIGEYVFGQVKGCFKSHVCVHRGMVGRVSPHFSLESSAGLPTIFMTALACFESLDIKTNTKVLVHAAAGGLGAAAMQVAQLSGAQVIGTAGSPIKRNFIRGLGFPALESRSSQFTDDLLLLCQNFGGICAVINTLTTPGMLSATISCIKFGGSLVEVSKRGIFSHSRVVQERLDIHPDILAIDFMPIQRAQAYLKLIETLMSTGQIKPVVSSMYELRHISSAFRTYYRAATIGKVVFVSSNDDLKSGASDCGTWAITGGLGALGQITGKFLVSAGLHVIMLAKSINPVQKYISYSSHLINIILCDINDPYQIEKALNSGGSKNIGLLHASGTLQDGVIWSPKIQKSRSVFGSKLEPLKTLFDIVRKGGMRFVAYGSISAFVGTPGQSNYSCSNALLAAETQSLNEQGVDSLAIHWGPWAGAGMAASLNNDKLQNSGLLLIPPVEGVHMLRILLLSFPTRQNIRYCVSCNEVFLKKYQSKWSITDHSIGSENGPLHALNALTEENSAPPLSRDDTVEILLRSVRPLLSDEPILTSPLMDMGLDSLGMVELVKIIHKSFSIDVSASFPFDHPTIDAMANEIHEILQGRVRSFVPISDSLIFSEIDISKSGAQLVGLSSRFPSMQQAGFDAARPIPLDRWNRDVIQHTYSPHLALQTLFGGFIDFWKSFDQVIFGMRDEEALLLDPQQRCLLEDTLALQHRPFETETMVAVGIGKLEGPRYVAEAQRFAVANGRSGLATGISASAAAGRLSFVFNLKGASVSIDTACSSTLVCLHMCVHALESKTSREALVCGANLPMALETSMLFAASGMLSRDGRCKTLDSSANGYGRSEGCSVVRLLPKRSETSTGDSISGIIASTAVNQDGRSSSLTSPNGPSQELALLKVLEGIHMGPSTLQCIGMHGTGTPLGDPIEVGALANIFSSRTGHLSSSRKQTPIHLLSSKSQLGHLETVSGLYGLIHLCQATSDHRSSMVVNLRSINKQVLKSIEDSEFAVPRENTPFQSSGGRYAAVSSFAFQGTNASASIEIHTASTSIHSRRTLTKPKLLFFIPFIHPGLLIAKIGASTMASCHFTLRPSMAGLNDHRIENMPILPGAYSVDLLLHLHAYMTSTTNELYVLRSIIFLRLVEIKDGLEILGHLHEEESISLELQGDTSAQFCRAEITQTMQRKEEKNGRRPHSMISTVTHQARTMISHVGTLYSTSSYLWNLLDANWHMATLSTPKSSSMVPSSIGFLTGKIESFDMITGSRICRLDSKDLLGSEVSSEINDENNTHRCMLLANLTFSQKHNRQAPSNQEANTVQLRLFSELYRVNYGLGQVSNPKITWEGDDHRYYITQRSRVLDPIDWALMLISQMQSLWKKQRIATWPLEEFFGSLISQVCPQTSLEPRIRLSACAWRLQRVEQKPPQGRTNVKERLHQQQAWPINESKLLQRDLKNKDIRAKRISGPAVVTGSNGGIGRLVMLWISQSSTRVVHFSRSKFGSSDPFTASRTDNFLMTYKMMDASATEDVERISHCGPKNPILLHCAGVLIDQALPFLEAAAFRKVTAPKYRGTLLCYRNTEKIASRCNILFGSAASVLGNPGQASYMMANTLMETIHQEKRQGGIPSHIIHWGPWDIGGMVDRKARRKLLMQGACFISPILGLKVLDSVLQGMHDLLDGYICVLAHNVADPKALAETKSELSNDSSMPECSKDALLRYVTETASAVSHRVVSSDSLFFNEGMDSLTAVEFSNILGAKLGVDLPSTLIYDFPTPKDMVNHLQEIRKEEQTYVAPVRMEMVESKSLYFCVRNAAYNFPNPRIRPRQHLERDWLAGDDLHGPVPWSRWEIDEVYAPQARIGCCYTRFGTWIEHPDMFDRELFEILPQECITLDPQARILLELAFECKTQDGSRNVANFVGVMYNEYLDLILGPHQMADTMPTAITGTGMSFLVGRISYHYGLMGPSAAIDTACSSSLVALHLSCQALMIDQPKASLAQGINLMLSPQTTARICLLKALSSDGRCKTLDASADGYGRGEGGCTMYIDKEHSVGVTSNHNPMAIIHGSGIGHNGTSGGLTAPNGSSQKDLLTSVSHRAGKFPRYISLHGTGTSLGDPIELGAVMDLHIPQGKNTNDPVYFASSKVCSGHTEGTAGLCGILLPIVSSATHSHGPFIHVRSVTQYVSNILSTKRITSALVPREPSPYVQVIPGQRTFGSSSFGMSGVNSHAICEVITHSWHKPHKSQFIFYKRRFWPRPDIGFLMDRYIASSRSFSVEFESPSLSWLKDHKIRGKSIVSASALLEIAIRVCSSLASGDGDGKVGILGVVFKQPLDQRGRCSISLSQSTFLLTGPKRSTVCTGSYEILALNKSHYIGDASHERRCDALCSMLSSIEVSPYRSKIAMLAEPKMPSTGFVSDPFAVDNALHLSLCPDGSETSKDGVPVSVGYFYHRKCSQRDMRFVSSLQKPNDSLDVMAPEVRLLMVLTQAFTRPSFNVLSTPAAYTTIVYARQAIDRSALKIPYNYEALHGCLIHILSEPGPMTILSTKHWHAVLEAIPNQVNKRIRMYGPSSSVDDGMSSKRGSINLEAILSSLTLVLPIENSSIDIHWTKLLALAQPALSPGTTSYVQQSTGIELASPQTQSLTNHMGIYSFGLRRGGLVTGAFGGIGSLVSQFLSLSCFTVVRCGRNLPARELLSGHENHEIWIKGDSSVSEDLQSLMRLQQWGQRLHEVHHASGILKDSLAMNTNPKSIEYVMAPKASAFPVFGQGLGRGAVQSVVAYSSISGVLGNFGQLAYGFSNICLDLQASCHNAAGLPILSIAWGPWQGTGMAANGQIVRRLKRTGVMLMTPTQGLLALSHAMRNPSLPKNIIVGLLRSYLRKNSGTRDIGYSPKGGASLRTLEASQLKVPLPSLEEMQQTKFTESADTTPLKDRRLISYLIRATIEEFFGAKISGDQHLPSTGLDSVQTVTLTDKLEQALGLQLSPTIFYDYPSLLDLEGYLIDQILSSSPSVVRDEASQDEIMLANTSSTAGSSDSHRRQITQIDSLSRQQASNNPPRLVREGYYCQPTLEELLHCADKDLATVDRFVIGRTGVGEIRFLYPVDIRGLDLGKCVEIQKGQIFLRGPESLSPGMGLNQPAILVFKGGSKRLFGSKYSRRTIKMRLRDACERSGAIFLHMDEDLGEWMVKVDSF